MFHCQQIQRKGCLSQTWDLVCNNRCINTLHRFTIILDFLLVSPNISKMFELSRDWDTSRRSLNATGNRFVEAIEDKTSRYTYNSLNRLGRSSIHFMSVNVTRLAPIPHDVVTMWTTKFTFLSRHPYGATALVYRSVSMQLPNESLLWTILKIFVLWLIVHFSKREPFQML